MRRFPAIDAQAAARDFAEDVRRGLAQRPRTLPCKYLYDERGSQLFEEITRLDAYYPTRTELSIMHEHARAMAKEIGPDAMVVELGSGSSLKTRLLLEALESPAAYVPVDISGEHLMASAESLAKDWPEIEILPVHADFTTGFSLPESKRQPRRTVFYFPGSTIGNFEPAVAKQLLSAMATAAGDRGGVLLGIDLVKPKAILERAYDDEKGITARFNLNLLERINRELGANFDLDRFEHRAIFNHEEARIEIYARSLAEQTVQIDKQELQFDAGEVILTEHSHKYTLPRLQEMGEEAGLNVVESWRDQEKLFCVAYLERAA